ncbi:MAG: GAF domain-containing protein [Bacteroidales bacterium]|nr:GAF domain-containing protein [Bacteroidales bacterium]
MNLSIKSKLIIFIILPLICLFVLIYVLILSNITSYNDSTIETVSSKTAENYTITANEKISNDIEVINSVKVFFENTKINSSELNESQLNVLKNVIVNHQDFSSVWVLFKDEKENGIISQYSRIENEIKYKNKIIGDDNFYNEIYIIIKNTPEEIKLFSHKKDKYKDENNFLFSLAAPIYKNNEIVGIAGIDFNFKKIFDDTEIKDESLDLDLMLSFNNELFNIKNTIFFNDENNDLKNAVKNSVNQLDKSFVFYSKQNKKRYHINISQLKFKSKSTNLSLIVISSTNKFNSLLSKFNFRFIILSVLTLLVLCIIILIISEKYLKRIKNTSTVLTAMATGKVSEIKDLETSENDEIAEINDSINTINLNLDKTASFIEEITKGNFNVDYKSLTDEDRIANSLLDMKASLEQAQETDIKRKEIDEKQKWATIGAAKFSEIIREHSDNLEELAYAIISDLVNYIDANQGGLFIINEDADNNKYIELLASYAYSRRKMLKKKIPWGVGLVGRCILEKETIFMSKIPEKYLSITSGLGEENPATLLLVPLIFHEEVFGVVELASFQGIEQYKIDLVEQISESIASAIQMVKINVRTAELLRETKIKSEQAASQEEEIRQNIEEMQASTEELNIKLEEITNTFNAVYSVANIAQFDLNGRVTDISDNFLKLLRKEKQDIIGKVQGSFSSEIQNKESFNKFWRELKRGKQMEFEQVINVENALVRIYSIYVPVKNSEGKVYKVISFAREQ